MYIDFHTHILPGIDDGARGIESSMRMMRQMIDGNVDTIVATPHYYHLEKSVDEFILDRDKAYSDILTEWKSSGETDALPEIVLGSEVYLSPELQYDENMTKLAFRGKILLEMPFNRYESWIESCIYNIAIKNKLIPVIAHVERYFDFLKDSDYDDLLSIPNVVFQINVSSMESKYVMDFVLSLLENGHRVIFGSDCHNSRHRTPDMNEYMPMLEKLLKKKKIYGQSKERIVYEDILGMSRDILG